jgi:hypothetical protein
MATAKETVHVELVDEPGPKRKKVNASTFLDLLIAFASAGAPGSDAESRVSSRRVGQKLLEPRPSSLGRKPRRGSAKA